MNKIKTIKKLEEDTLNELWSDYKDLFEEEGVTKKDIKISPADSFMGNGDLENIQFDLGYLSALQYVRSLISKV